MLIQACGRFWHERDVVWKPGSGRSAHLCGRSLGTLEARGDVVAAPMARARLGESLRRAQPKREAPFSALVASTVEGQSRSPGPAPPSPSRSGRRRGLPLPRGVPAIV